MTLRLVEEVISDLFDKQHIEGLERPATFHRIVGEDHGRPHCHPWDFDSFIIDNGYIEEVFTPNLDGSWSVEVIERLPMTLHHVRAETVHRIIGLPRGPARTLIFPGLIRRDFQFYDIEVAR